MSPRTWSPSLSRRLTSIPLLDDGLDTITRWALPTSAARLAVALVMGVVLAGVFGWRAAAAWATALGLSETAGWFAIRPHRQGRSSSRRERAAYLASLLFMNGIWATASTAFWLTGRPPLMLAGALGLTSQMFHAQTFTSRSASAFAIVGGVPAATLLLLVCTNLSGTPLERISAVAAVLCLLAYMVAGARANRRHAVGLEAARAEAQAASAAKSAFLATVSHELRTPLAAVLGGADLLGRSRLTSEQAAHLELLKLGGRSLMAVLNDLLDMARIEAGRLPVDPRPTDVRELAEQLTALWAPRAAESGVRVDLFVEDAVPETVLLDGDRLRQIASNLLSNAVKFAPDSQVSVRLRVAGGDLLVEVADTGAGMSSEVLERMFEPFARGADHGGRREPGAGLGLSISRQLAELMGGRLTASSQPGRGSTFRLHLPLASGGSWRPAPSSAAMIP